VESITVKMNKAIILTTILVLLVSGCINDKPQPPKDEEQQLVGESCASVSPTHRNECCERKNKDTLHIDCVGSWEYKPLKGQCEFVCQQTIKNFEECISAGHPILESYPRQCRTPSGETYTEIIPQEPERLTKQVCEASGGKYNECSNKCMLMNQGKEAVACTAHCEVLCECGGIAGYTCPDGFSCITPEGVSDALGYCEKTKPDYMDLVNANNRFAIELYKKLNRGDKNVFFSPFSIETALAMALEGARGSTESEMLSVLHLPKDAEKRRTAFKLVLSGLKKPNKEFELYAANAIWPQKDYPFLSSYIDVVKDYCGNDVVALDYKTKTEESRKTINAWVENKTKDKIKELIPSGVLTPMTRMVLTNAIYFKGLWLLPFDEANTNKQDFKVSKEETVEVDMMSLSGSQSRFPYTQDEQVQVLKLPYKGNQVSMLVILSREDSLSSVEESLTPKKIEGWKSNLLEREVLLQLPKFKLETKYMLPQQLKDLGMPTAFSSDADFSGMDGTRSLYISDVIHQAFVEVNEEGTEAAAATAVVIAKLSMPKYEVFRADHPFIFLIQDDASGNILFMGRVTNPTK